MILNVLVILFTGAIALMWGLRGKGRGFFSSFLALVCTVIAGAVAFAAWEPLAYGFLLGFREDFAWGLALVLPFVATLIVTRLLIELVIPKNVRMGDTENFIGGFLCGVGNGVITVGIAVLALTFFTGPPSLAGHSPIESDRGNLVYKRSLWLPVDRLTVGLYEALSMNAFSTPTPLAQRAPRLYEQAALSRQVFTRDDPDGKRVARTTILPEQFVIRGHYTVGETRERVVFPDGGSPNNPQTHGFIVEFRAGAGEQGTGQVVIGNGQARLIARSDGGRGDRVVAAHPFAAIAMRQDGLGVHRWVFDADEIFIGSVGGGDSAIFTLEFALPPNYQPTDLFIKNARVPLQGTDLAQPRTQFASADLRNRAIQDGSLFREFGVAAGVGEVTIVATDAITISPDVVARAWGGLPENWILSGVAGTGGLTVQGRDIRSGTGTFPLTRLTDRTIPLTQRIDTFLTTADTTIVQVQLASAGNFSPVGEDIVRRSMSGAPVIVDSQNRAYPAVGFVYADGTNGTISYTPSRPLENLQAFPAALSPARGNQTAHLIFRPTRNVQIVGFGFRTGDNQVDLVARFNPPLQAGNR